MTSRRTQSSRKWICSNTKLSTTNSTRSGL